MLINMWFHIAGLHVSVTMVTAMPSPIQPATHTACQAAWWSTTTCTCCMDLWSSHLCRQRDRVYPMAGHAACRQVQPQQCTLRTIYTREEKKKKQPTRITALLIPWTQLASTTGPGLGLRLAPATITLDNYAHALCAVSSQRQIRVQVAIHPSASQHSCLYRSRTAKSTPPRPVTLHDIPTLSSLLVICHSTYMYTEQRVTTCLMVCWHSLDDAR